jgi:UDP-N-acetylglucosamine 2-epimerase (non-hydrolysing)
VPVAHVEAGLRSFDRRMPEEINRIVTDALAYIPLRDRRVGIANLAEKASIPTGSFLVGNVMIDTLRARCCRQIRERHGWRPRWVWRPAGYGVVTLHRPSNVDDVEMLERLGVRRDGTRSARTCRSSSRPIRELPRGWRAAGLLDRLAAFRGQESSSRSPYVEFISLVADSRVVLTDSGGIQEETTVLGVPCLTLRESTERPVTVRLGTNRSVGVGARADALRALDEALDVAAPKPPPPPLWDGHAAERIVEILDRLEWSALGTGG